MRLVYSWQEMTWNPFWILVLSTDFWSYLQWNLNWVSPSTWFLVGNLVLGHSFFRLLLGYHDLRLRRIHRFPLWLIQCLHRWSQCFREFVGSEFIVFTIKCNTSGHLVRLWASRLNRTLERCSLMIRILVSTLPDACDLELDRQCSAPVGSKISP